MHCIQSLDSCDFNEYDIAIFSTYQRKYDKRCGLVPYVPK